MGDTQKNSSRQWLEMDPQSSLDEFLTGVETKVLSGEAQKEIDNYEAQLADGFMDEPDGWRRHSKRENARRQIRRIKEDESNYVTERSGGYLQGSFQDLVRMAESEENVGDILRGREAQLNLADYLSNLQAPEVPSMVPGQEVIDYSTGFARDIFAPQQNQLNQLFQDQRMQANRTAAIQGRAGNDPILLANLAEAQAREQGMLGARQSALAAQTARELPQQDYQNRMNNLLQNVNFRTQGAALFQDQGQQALRNRLAVLGVGQGLAQAERQFRLATAEQRGESKSTTSPGALSIAGGIAGGIGAIAPLFTGGAGAGTGLFQLLQNQNQPQQQQHYSGPINPNRYSLM